MKNIYLVIALAFLFTSNNLFAQNNKAQKIMQQVEAQSEIHKTQESRVFMKILDRKKRQRERYFNYTKKILNNTETRSLVKFYKPTNIKNTALLSYSFKNKSTTQWLYLPAFKNVKKLSTEEKNQSFMGSDFSIADIAGRRVNQDTHKLTKEDKKFYYIESVPKDKNDNYSKLEITVAKKIYVPIRIVFYDKNKKKLKTLENSSIKKIKGMYIITKSLMENHQTSGSTLTENSNIKVGIPISNTEVGIRGLKQ